VRDSVEGVGNRHHPRCHRNHFPTKLSRVTSAIPAFVVTENALWKIRVKSCKRAQDIRSALWVFPDGLTLCRSESRVLPDDIRQGTVELSDIVKQRDPLDTSAHSLIQVCCAGKNQRILRDTSYVRSRFRAVRVDRVEQGLERGSAKPFHGNALSVLPRVESAGGRTGKKGNESKHHAHIGKKRTSFRPNRRVRVIAGPDGPF